MSNTKKNNNGASRREWVRLTLEPSLNGSVEVFLENHQGDTASWTLDAEDAVNAEAYRMPMNCMLGEVCRMGGRE